MESTGAGRMVYQSKRDSWIVAALWAASIAAVVAAVRIWSIDTSPWMRVGFTVFMGGAVVLVLWTLHGTWYELDHERLLIRSGPFRWEVELRVIRQVTPKRSLLSGPAMSLDRLEIRYESSPLPVMISPEDRKLFLSDLVDRVPGLRLREDGLAALPAEIEGDESGEPADDEPPV